MSITSEYYTQQAIQNERDAEAAALDNVRERCLRSAKAWRQMAERLTRSETMRAAQAAEKAARLDEEGEDALFGLRRGG